MEKILNVLKVFWRRIPKWILAILIAVGAGLIFKSVGVGALTLIGIVAALTIFILGRQIWWFLTSTGDSKNRNRKITIKKGRHYPFPGFFVLLPKWVSKNKTTRMSRSYYFTDTCLYDLGNADQLDTNKLFGFSIGKHHNNSFRFGWRPNKTKDKIEILSYEYRDGERVIDLIREIDINKWIHFEIEYLNEYVKYIITANEEHKATIGTNKFSLKKKFGLGYKLGFYFGGNQTAPHKIKVLKLLKPIIKI